MRYLVNILAVVFLSTAFNTTAAYAADVTPMRILSERKVTVVTNARTDTLARHFLNWEFVPDRTISLFELILQRDNLKTDGDVLFIVDTSKPIPPKEAELLPIPLAVLEKNEVLTAVVKKSIGNQRNYKNGWQIMVAAPNQEWLDKELGLMPKVLGNRISEKPGAPTKLHFYNVLQLDIISNAEKSLAVRWAERQLDPNYLAIDYNYNDLDTWRAYPPQNIPSEDLSSPLNLDQRPAKGRSLVFVLDNQKLREHEKIYSGVTENIREWMEKDSSRSEGFAGAGEIEVMGHKIKTYALIAANARLLEGMVARFPTVESISFGSEIVPFFDLSDCRQMAIMVRFADKSATEQGLLHDFSNKLLAELGSSSTGFVTRSYHDIKELQIDKFFAEDNPSDEQAEAASGGRGLMVVSLASVALQTTYTANEPISLTKPYPAFTEPEPTEPIEPSLSDRKYGIAGPKLYTGPNDPKYVQRKNQYYRDLRKWEQKYSYWRARRDNYQLERSKHRMEWAVQVDQIATVEVTGNIAIYDTADEEEIGARVLYTTPIRGFATKRDFYKDIRIDVVGEGAAPSIRGILPESKADIDDHTIISNAFESASRSVVRRITENCILPIDLISK